MNLGRAFALQIWWERRSHFAGVALAMLAMALIYPVLFSYSRGPVAVGISVFPLILISSLSLNGVTVREVTGLSKHGYPVRMFALPVAAWQLVIWPMAIGLAVIALIAALAVGIYRVSGFDVPVLLVTLGAVTTQAWLQTLTWTPFRSPSARVVLSSLTLMSLIAPPALAFGLRWVGQPFLAPLLLTYAVAALVLARPVVAVARRGDAIGWRGWNVDLYCLAKLVLRRDVVRPPFSSRWRAQAWYEWRCSGVVLPLGTCGGLLIILPVMLLAWLIQGDRPAALAVGFLPLLLAGPPLFAGSMAGTIGNVGSMMRRTAGAMSFLGTRPITSGEMVTAKFAAMLAGVLLSWLATFLGAGVMLLICGKSAIVSDKLAPLIRAHSAGTLFAVGMCSFPLLVVVTWKGYTSAVTAAMTGKTWCAGAAAVVNSALLLGGLMLALTPLLHPEYMPLLLNWAPVAVVLTATAKLSVAGWAMRGSVRAGLVSQRCAVGVWAFAAIAMLVLSVLIAALEPAKGYGVATWVVALAGLHAIPLARFGLAPLALEWQRHQ